MHPLRSPLSLPLLRRSARLLLLAAAGLAAQAQAQAVPVAAGTLSNFDVYNDTGEICEGFEIELEGLDPSDISYSFGGNGNSRYGAPNVSSYPGGVHVRYEADFDPATQTWSTGTPVPATRSPTNGHECWAGGSANYLSSGCEHFGVSLARNATATRYRWLKPDPGTPGLLIPHAVDVALPAPVWAVVPPAVPAAAPVIRAELPAPPPEVQAQWGEARWMKIYKTEIEREVDLDELLSDNAVVPREQVETEVEWRILQFNPDAADEGREVQEAELGNGKKSVIRRYEFYAYTGLYDPENHEALCADGSCDVPQEGELGEYVGAQMAAINLGDGQPQTALGVTRRGNGRVLSDPPGIALPGLDMASFPSGSSITLSASPALGFRFLRWLGDCSGRLPTCTVLADAPQKNVVAQFKPLPRPTLTVGSPAGGSVRGSHRINCGSSGTACSATTLNGVTVVLRAYPDAQRKFSGWTGACSGRKRVCRVTLTADTQVGASFR